MLEHFRVPGAAPQHVVVEERQPVSPARTWKASASSVERRTTIVGHLAPDLDCLMAIWLLMRFGGVEDANLEFIPSGRTYHDQPADADPRIIHVDTGHGRFDHHQRPGKTLCAAELVRRAVASGDLILKRMVQQVCQIDHAIAPATSDGVFAVAGLVAGYNQLFPEQPQQVVAMMQANFDAWYACESRQIRLEQAYSQRIEFRTQWGLGIAMECSDGGSSKLAYNSGAILYVYRDGQGWMGIAAQSRSAVDLSQIYANLRIIDHGADWYLHPNKRLLLCGSAKAPPEHPSCLSLAELVQVIEEAALARAGHWGRVG